MCNFHTLCYSAIVFLWVAAARHNLKLVRIKHVNVAIKSFKTTFVMVGSVRYSDRSIFRQVYIPTGRYSDRSLFRQVYIPTGRYSDRCYSDRSIGLF